MRKSARLNAFDYVKVSLAAAAVVMTFASGPADARPSTRSYTCDRVLDLIYDRGAIVMNTKNSHIYRRFVANRSYCDHRETTFTYIAPTRTGPCQLLFCKKRIIFDRD